MFDSIEFTEGGNVEVHYSARKDGTAAGTAKRKLTIERTVNLESIRLTGPGDQMRSVKMAGELGIRLEAMDGSEISDDEAGPGLCYKIGGRTFCY